MQKKLILASSSPRRKILLESLHIPFQVVSSDVDESYSPQMSPEEIVIELAGRKAKAVSKMYPDSYILGADTVVVFEKAVLGKPKNRTEAFNMLQNLSGQLHQVYTGVSIICLGKQIQFYEKTDVAFWELSEEEMNAYLDTGESMDKAGGYGIQGYGKLLVKAIKGDYFTVVGLPLSRTIQELKKIGFPPPF
ncbi:septum formation inhibitor Maf [Bacillaceae bacterium Marseille-Q3522]|nr:septum formation inhibitor Maf [Bacillaceae bacterium Marseille-Q3522]